MGKKTVKRNSSDFDLVTPEKENVIANERYLKLRIMEISEILEDISDFQEALNDIIFVKNFAKLSFLKTYLNEILQSKDKYCEIYRELACDDQDLTEFLTIKQFKSKMLEFQEAVSEFENLKVASFNSNGAENSHAVGYHPNLQTLPPLSLPKFDGNYSEFRTFFDGFKAVIDNLPIPNVQKFVYLKSCLTGEANAAISGLKTINENYAIALDILQERYDKPNLIIQQHIKNIFEIKQVTKKSAKQLKELLDGLNKNLLCLENLNISGEKLAAALLQFIISNKVDYDTREKFKKYRQDSLLTTKDIIDFMQSRVKFLIDMDIDNVVDNRPTQQSRHFGTKTSLLVASEVKHDNKYACVLCQSIHPIQYCEQFKKLTPLERYQKVKELHLCKNCLQHNESKPCRSKFSCRTCERNHHSMLHFDKRPVVAEKHSENSQLTNCKPSNPKPNLHEIITVADVHPQPILACQNLSAKNVTLLSTVQVYIYDALGNPHLVRGILDNGSQQNLLSKRIADKLNLPIEKVYVKIAGLNSEPVNINESMQVELKSSHNNYHLNMSCLIVSSITNQIPVSSIDISHIKIPSNVKLADEQFNKPNPIDLLIGGSHFWHLLCDRQISLGHKQPMLQKTKLGYIVTGDIYPKREPIDPDTSLVNLCFSNEELHDSLNKFFQLDQVSPVDPKLLFSKEEQYCENHFDNTVIRNKTGRFCVSIPFNKNIDKLGNSFNTALSRFTSLENRLSKNPKIKALYSEFMSEYLSLQHMTLLSNIETELPRYYLPHFEIIRNNSLTTKIRVVFDGGSRTDTGISLNECQCLGPAVQDTLFSILLRFRSFPIALIADCEKMYRQIEVKPEDTFYQCILWRNNPTEQLNVYRLKTLTYGLKSSSYLATKCIQKLALINASRYPNASKIILSQMYMDDLLAGGSTISDVIILREQVTEILASAGIPLRKFLSNESAVLPKENSNNVECFTVPIQEVGSAKALGVIWNPTTDTLHYEFDLDITNLKITKRSILSVVSKLFDPLNLISPLIIKGKILIQRIWQEHHDWDVELPIKFQNQFLNLIREFSQVNTIIIPRLFLSSNPLRFELHGFADASEVAYGAVLYVRCVNLDKINVAILCSKSRVAPLKATVTIPRLELCACVLLAELYSKVYNSVNCKFEQTYLWSDSQIAIQWINSPPNQFKIFVANRVSVINQLTERQMWKYVPTKENPADYLSRGTSLDNMGPNGLWFLGPQFLNEPQHKWPRQTCLSSKELNLPELKSTTLLISNLNDDILHSIIHKLSSYSKILRVVAYVRRFVFNLKSRKLERRVDYLTTIELNEAMFMIIKLIQSSCFSGELAELKSKNYNKVRNKKFSGLSAFIDRDGIIRVGGRLSNADLNYDTIHPIILPKNHRLTYLIVEYYHKKFLHCGPNQLLSVIREKFWLLSGRQTCKTVVRKCVTCFKFSPVLSETKTGNLPSYRLKPYHACFENTGCDFTGFFFIKNSYSRKCSLLKAYVCIFICLISKAVHLELVTSLSADAFIEAFKRFVARRGKPLNVYSDNGTNFVGAANVLKEFYTMYKKQSFQNQIAEYVSNQEINWKFIPPRSPHFGGLWESNIKRIKAHLYKILKDTKLTYESFSTVLCQIENILNSRPLSPLSSDPSDMRPLTPFHFLIGKAGDCIPEPTLESMPTGRLDQYQLRQQLINHFWKRWSKEVLLEHQRLAKSSSDATQPLKLGDMVMLAEENLHTLQWPLGRVVNVHPGLDGIVRVVSLKLSNGKTTQRAVKKLCVLPIES